MSQGQRKTPEQIIHHLGEAEMLLAQGLTSEGLQADPVKLFRNG